MLKKLAAIFMMTATVSVFAQAIVTESTSNSTTNSNSKSETTVKSPPPSAIAPSINSMNNDLCTVGVSGAAQTQILGIAIGSTFRDENCERLKLSKNLYDMGMKVAAVASLCQDERVFVAMMNAGTPCPINGKIGAEAKAEWNMRDLSAVDANKKLGTTGFYRAPINIREESKETTPNPNQSSCNGYTGNDPIVRSRMEC
jgi:hypothetical protein